MSHSMPFEYEHSVMSTIYSGVLLDGLSVLRYRLELQTSQYLLQRSA